MGDATEEAGVHVVYKREPEDALQASGRAPGGRRRRRYAHIGTGNYNRATSRVHRPRPLHGRPAVLDDVGNLNYLTGYHSGRSSTICWWRPSAYAHGLGAAAREMAHVQAGRPAHVIIKNNAVTDPAIVRALYRAAQAGVEIDMIVRGVCCLRPGIDGISERIRVRSVVGRFLEHSRIYYFKNAGQPEVYVGSADLMERNLDRRVETLCPVRNPGIADHLRDVVLEVPAGHRPLLRPDRRPLSAPTPRWRAL